MNGANDLMSELKREYTESLPQKLCDIRKLLTAVKTRRTDREKLEELRTAIHQLHGTAGTYNLDEIGDVAGPWDEFLFDLSEREILDISDRDISIMCAYLAHLTEAVRAAILANTSLQPK